MYTWKVFVSLCWLCMLRTWACHVHNCELYLKHCAVSRCAVSCCAVLRVRYTGEDGFELSIPNTHMVQLAEALVADPEVRAATHPNPCTHLILTRQDTHPPSVGGLA